MRGIHFGSQVTHLEESTKTNHPLNRTLVNYGTKIDRAVELRDQKTGISIVSEETWVNAL